MTKQQSTVYLCLGANLGDRLLALRQSVRHLDERDDLNVRKVSGAYETEPWGLPEQPKFLNIAVEIETALAPLELLHAVKALEKRMGRLPEERWGPRPIDIDIILWGRLVMRTPELTLPHEHFRVRHFVLAPLAEIAPCALDPETGLTVSELLHDIEPQAAIRRADVIFS
ncbi:MAG TPA: 2-amino-4-hydroxy-6-hydroxymethyldihydropteridine diphosphokinase [Candidatus Hydrogenedentes bacterium]|nr:2-amino-4-hydroxy-6-hydroxymethyldihydropteridine diphosphokinase [Candidatus Hydrogenedentota bacterium]